MMPTNRGRSGPVVTTARPEIHQALGQCRWAFFSAGFFSFFINMLMLTGPLFMMQVYDRVLASSSVPTLVALIGLVAGLYMFMGLLELTRSRVLSRIGTRIDHDLKPRTFRIWVTGGLLGRQAPSQPLSDLQMIRQFFAGTGPIALFDMPWVPIYLMIIFLLHWTLGLVATVGAIAILIIALINEFLISPLLARANQAQLQSTGFAQLCRRNAEAVLAMGMGQHVRSRWLDLQGKAAKDQLQASDRAGGMSALSKSFRLFLQSAILATGAVLVIEQSISAGAMIAASIIMGRALAPIDLAIGQWRSFVGARQSWTRLSGLFEAAPAAAEVMALPAPAGRLSVDGVVVVPPGANKGVLEGLSFSLEPGQGLGVVGPSASGKTSLARLLIGLWTPTRGTIRLDGATFDQWNRDVLGRYLGYLPQNVELFDGTVKDNIARFDPLASDGDVVQAARWAGAHDMILGLPEGYETLIGELGAILSGGQRQRIGLARALFGDPVLVVLDEPNASLDADGDAALTAAIRGLKERGRMVIVMAHRPSAIAAVDMLLALKDGRQCAFGPKDKVLREITRVAPVNPEPPKEKLHAV